MSLLTRSAARMFADALYMQIELPYQGSSGSGKHCKGTKTMTLYLPGGPKIPFTLEIIADFASQQAKADAGLLMRGPGEFIFFLGRTHSDQGQAVAASSTQKGYDPEASKQFEMCVAAVFDGRLTDIEVMRAAFPTYPNVDSFLKMYKPVVSFVRTGTNPEWTPL